MEGPWHARPHGDSNRESSLTHLLHGTRCPPVRIGRCRTLLSCPARVVIKVGAAAQREGAFRSLYEATHLRVLAYCLRRTDDRSAAHDATAEVYVVAWRRWDELPDDQDLVLPWLLASARRVLSNQHRGKRRRRRLLTRLSAAAPPPDDSVAGAVERHEEAVLVRAALTTLSEDDQEVLRLDAWEELSGVQLAAALGCTRNAAQVRLHRARRRLAAAYDRRSMVTERPWVRGGGGA